MSDVTTDVAIRTAIGKALPDATIEVASGGCGHFSISVVSAAFAGKSMVQSHRLVYSAIAHLMRGSDAPVHAIDSMRTQAR